MTSRAAATLLTLAALAPNAYAQPKAAPTIDAFLSAGFPSELVAARKADRIAWLAWEKGKRNVYAASAPGFAPRRLTRFLDDDGIELSDLQIADDGATVVFVRGSDPNRVGWIANPTGDPRGQERAIWAARTDGTGAWRISAGTTPAVSPDGRWVAFARDSALFVVRVAPGATSAVDRGERPLVRAWGRNLSPRWSPDGSKLAFVSDRTDHAFVGIYDATRHTVTYMAPSVDRDASPTWSPDGKRVAFIRRPGLAFGQQAHDATGSLGEPPGPAWAISQRARIGADTAGATAKWARTPGLARAAFAGGYTLSFWVADATTGDGHEVWHNAPNDRAFPSVASIQWAGDHLVFAAEPEEWTRVYAVSAAGGSDRPVELTPGTGAVESLGLSPDGRTLYYATNAGDIDRRHVWKVPTAGGEAVQLTRGEEIEMYPAPLGSARQVAMLTSSATRPFSVALMPASGGAPRVIYPTLGREFPTEAHVTPQAVLVKSDDGLEIHDQLFLPKDLKPGERRPAIVFVHGGPVRQMLLGYHYMDFYHMAYAVNEWLASQGYVVLSVNYRSGIGYGKAFRQAPNVGGRGNAEYKDVLAAGKYLQSRPDVDPTRVGIWGLSYGGVLTAQALARNSDLFAAGVDMAGVHLWGSTLDSTDLSYKSSAIAAIDGWKSPVLLWHGDDDRNVQFSQTTGLVQLLRAHNVPFELIVNPDDTHETLLYSRWLTTYARMQDFLRRNLWDRKTATTSSTGTR
ncbi:S9 family peptidase [Gemmatirosa kalamazoonensis]|nr:prolyl oligopeptidase family serine peptidase [Gemmatirosa kalamazoonensis]